MEKNTHQVSYEQQFGRVKRFNAAQNTQQPVAWLSIDCIGERYLCFSEPSDNDEKLALYTAPPVSRDVLMAFGEAVCDECARHYLGDEEDSEIDLSALADRYASQVRPERCQCCGYLVTESEHKGCLRAGRAANAPEPVNQQLLRTLHHIEGAAKDIRVERHHIASAARAAIAVAEAAQPVVDVATATSGFFVYDDNVGFERVGTAARAKELAQEAVDEYRHEAGEGWPEEVENVCWGVVLGATKEVPIADSDGNSTDWAGDRYVDYVLTDCQQPASAHPVAVPEGWE